MRVIIMVAREGDYDSYTYGKFIRAHSRAYTHTTSVKIVHIPGNFFKNGNEEEVLTFRSVLRTYLQYNICIGYLKYFYTRDIRRK
jgi:hypothetical protein